MKRFASSFFAACLSLGIGVPAITASASAGTPAALIAPALTHNAQAPVENVQYYDYRGDRRHWRHHHPRYRDGYRHHRPHYRPHYRNWGPPPRYRHHPPRYRPAPIYRGGNRHINWCYNRYRSYRAHDNTFQPNYGPRRQCYSPYI